MMQVSSHRTLGSQHISLDEKNNQMMTTVARAKVEAEIRQLMDSGSITLSLNSLLHDFDQRNQRCAFLKFCEMMMSADLVKCYLLIRDDYWNSLDDTLICDSIVRRIRTFFSNGSPNFLLSDETLNDKVLVDSTPELFDKVANEILKIRQKQLFENFLCYLANNKLAANLPSFQTCLTEGSATGEMFLNFCRTLRCEEILLFWREATAFEENVGSDFETYHEAIAIYDQYLAPNAASFFGADGHKVFAELEKGKSDRSMFRSIKKEAEQVLGQDLWPNFISNGLDEGKSSMGKLFDMMKSSGTQESSSFQSMRRKLSVSFETHPFFDVPSQLRFIRLPRPKDGYAEIVLHHVAGGKLSVVVKDMHFKELLKIEDLDFVQAKAIIKCFCIVNEGKYVANFAKSGKKRTVQLLDKEMVIEEFE